MHQINGFMFGDLGIEMCKGDKVLFYGFGIGDELDIHGISFSGNGIEVDGNNKDSVMIFPGKYSRVPKRRPPLIKELFTQDFLFQFLDYLHSRSFQICVGRYFKQSFKKKSNKIFSH